MKAEIRVMQKPKNANTCQQTTKSQDRDMKQIFPHSPGKEPTLSPWSSSLQNCKTINFSCLRTQFVVPCYCIPTVTNTEGLRQQTFMRHSGQRNMEKNAESFCTLPKCVNLLYIFLLASCSAFKVNSISCVIRAFWFGLQAFLFHDIWISLPGSVPKGFSPHQHHFPDWQAL